VYEYKIEKCRHNVGQVAFKHNKSACDVINNLIPYGMWDKRFHFLLNVKPSRSIPTFKITLLSGEQWKIITATNYRRHGVLAPWQQKRLVQSGDPISGREITRGGSIYRVYSNRLVSSTRGYSEQALMTKLSNHWGTELLKDASWYIMLRLKPERFWICLVGALFNIER